MAEDYADIATRLAVGSEILRVYPNAVIQLLDTGTSDVVAQVTADANGEWEVATLDTGIYDIKVDGQIRRTIHFVRADHKHLVDEPWTFFQAGAISADQDENNQIPVHGTDVVGSIVKIVVTAQAVGIIGDLTVHLLKGASAGASILTVASDSVWSHRINPLAVTKRYLYVDNNPGISVAADEAVTLGLDWVAVTVEGVCLVAVFRPTATYPT